MNRREFVKESMTRWCASCHQGNEYLREMKRYSVLEADFDLKNPRQVDAYKLDLKYYDLFYPEPN